MRIFGKESKQADSSNLSVSLLWAGLPLSLLMGLWLGYQIWGKPNVQLDQQNKQADGAIRVTKSPLTSTMPSRVPQTPKSPSLNLLIMNAATASAITRPLIPRSWSSTATRSVMWSRISL